MWAWGEMQPCVAVLRRLALRSPSPAFKPPFPACQSTHLVVDEDELLKLKAGRRTRAATLQLGELSLALVLHRVNLHVRRLAELGL